MKNLKIKKVVKFASAVVLVGSIALSNTPIVKAERFYEPSEINYSNPTEYNGDFMKLLSDVIKEKINIGDTKGSAGYVADAYVEYLNLEGIDLMDEHLREKYQVNDIREVFSLLNLNYFSMGKRDFDYYSLATDLFSRIGNYNGKNPNNTIEIAPLFIASQFIGYDEVQKIDLALQTMYQTNGENDIQMMQVMRSLYDIRYNPLSTEEENMTANEVGVLLSQYVSRSYINHKNNLEYWAGLNEEASPIATREWLASKMADTLDEDWNQQPTIIFNDVDYSSLDSKAINVVSNAGLMTGYGDGNFGGQNNVTFEQAVVVLCKRWGVKPVKSSSNPTKASDWAKDYVNAAIVAGIINDVPFDNVKDEVSQEVLNFMNESFIAYYHQQLESNKVNKLK